MFSWLRNVFRQDRGMVDFTKIEDHIEVQQHTPPVKITTSKYNPTPITAYDKLLQSRDMTDSSTMIQYRPTTISMMEAEDILRGKIEALRKDDK